MTCHVLKRRGSPDLAYVVHRGQENAPTLLFLCGYRSDMTGSKASALAAWVKTTPYSLVLFDYSGHGQSGGQIQNFTLSNWVQDAHDICAAVSPTGPVILVGSSMGGWIALRYALAHPDRIMGIVGIAAAPDFTIYMEAHDLTAEQRITLARTGMVELPSTLGPDPYVITKALIDDGARNAVLTTAHDLAVPMILLQGGKDAVVPAHAPDAIAQAFPKASITIHRIVDGDHGLSRPQDLAVLYQGIETLAHKAV